MNHDLPRLFNQENIYQHPEGGGAAQQRNNVLLAGALFAFTGGVYYTAMGKMRATDELGELEALENKVNVHESGLKITRPRSVHDALQPRKED